MLLPGLPAASTTVNSCLPCAQVLMTASSLANRSPEDIARLLEVNPSATLTDTGAIVFGCSLHPADNHSHDHHGTDSPHQPQQPELQPVPQPPPGRDVWDEKDLSKALRLHSRPSATKKIFLEFTGCITQVGATVCQKPCQLDTLGFTHCELAVWPGSQQLWAACHTAAVGALLRVQ